MRYVLHFFQFQIKMFASIKDVICVTGRQLGVLSYLRVVPPCVSPEFPSPPILASLSFCPQSGMVSWYKGPMTLKEHRSIVTPTTALSSARFLLGPWRCSRAGRAPARCCWRTPTQCPCWSWSRRSCTARWWPGCWRGATNSSLFTSSISSFSVSFLLASQLLGPSRPGL